MNSPQQISSLSELKKRKRELQLEIEVSKREFSHSVGSSRDQIGEFLLKRVALPLGGLAAGIYFLRKIVGSKEEEPKVIREKIVLPPEPSMRQNAAAPVSPAPVSDDQEAKYQAMAARAELADEQQLTNEEVVEKSFDFAKVATVARLAIPAVQAIISAVNDKDNQ